MSGTLTMASVLEHITATLVQCGPSMLTVSSIVSHNCLQLVEHVDDIRIYGSDPLPVDWSAPSNGRRSRGHDNPN
jgi:hypothetical protein